MNGTSSPPALLPLEASSEALPLDERVRAAEQRLMARERALVSRIGEFGQRLRTATRPQRVIPPALGVGVALVALGWLLFGRRAPGAAARAGAGVSPAARSALTALPWGHWLALAWPLLPVPLRARVKPATAATLISVGLPLVQRLLAPSGHAPLATMPYVDLGRYAGTWHEIARLPTPYEKACDGQPSAHYALRGGGLGVRNQCTHRGEPRVARGVARALPRSGNARLKVSFWPSALRWLPMAWADYWVLHADPAYRVAVVGHPNRRHLWVLARRRHIGERELQSLVAFAAERGFPVERLIVSQRA